MKEKGEKKGESANNRWKYTQKVTKIKIVIQKSESILYQNTKYLKVFAYFFSKKY